MKTSKSNIEGLFNDGFKDHAVNPSNSVWIKINRKLNFQNFLKFNPGKFNIYYTAVLAVASSVVLYNTLNNTTITENIIPERNEIIISENKPNTKILDINNKSDNQTIEINNIESTKNNSSTENLNETEKETNRIEISEKTTIIKNYIAKVESNDEDKENVNLAYEPYAEFSASVTKACVPVAVHFLNASENCDSYSWDFGNGETSSDINPTFVFRAAGTYTVTLTVKSGSIFKTVSSKITVYPKPVSEFIISDKNNIFENDEVKFANLSTDYQSCSWDFGNGNTSSFKHPIYSYDKSGLYTVSLICLSDNNCSDTSEFLNIEIRDSKYQIMAPTGLFADLNGPGNGYLNTGTASKTIFSPLFNYETSEYYLRILNRFGSVVFESKDPNYGWNGYFNNKPAPIATYIWECSGKFTDGQVFVKRGNLTLLYLNNQ